MRTKTTKSKTTPEIVTDSKLPSNRRFAAAVGLRQSDAVAYALRLIGMMMQEAHTKGQRSILVIPGSSPATEKTGEAVRSTECSANPAIYRHLIFAALSASVWKPSWLQWVQFSLTLFCLYMVSRRSSNGQS